MEENSLQDYIRGGLQKSFYGEHEREGCTCPHCNATAYRVIDQSRGLSVVQCSACGLLYTNPRAKAAEQNYFGDPKIYEEEARFIFEGKQPHHRDRNYKYELKQIKKFKPAGRLLDVGTNMGFFLRMARDMGYETEGVEPSPSLSKMASEKFKLKIHNAYLNEVSLPSTHYDIITLIDVFEHVTDPKGMLRRCHELLKADGILVIKVPNGDYNHFKMSLSRATGKGKDLDIWDCCEHVVHYTPPTFRRMVESEKFRIVFSCIPLPIHPPRWHHITGHYYLHPTPFRLDWKRILLRNAFYYTGKIAYALTGRTRFGPDLMFVLKKAG